MQEENWDQYKVKNSASAPTGGSEWDQYKVKKKAVFQPGGYGSQLGSTSFQDTKDLLYPTSKKPAGQKVGKVQNNKPSSLDRNLEIYAAAQGTPMAEVVKNIPVYKSEVRQGQADRGFMEKVLDGAGYIVSGLGKGVQNLATGALGLAQYGQFGGPIGNIAMGQAAEKLQPLVDKGFEKILASKQTEARYGDMNLTSQLRALAEFIPASVGASSTGGASFFLNGYGSGLNEVKKMKDEGVKFENGSDDVYALGRGVVDLLLMSRLNSHTIFSKLPQSLRDNVIKRVSMDALGEVGKLGEKATAESVVNLFKKKALDFDTKFRQFGTNYLKSYAMTTLDLNALNAANFGLGKIANKVSGNEMFTQTPEELLEGAKKIVTLEAPIFAGFGAVKSAGQLFRKSEYTNEVISNLYKDSSPENVEAIKQQLAAHLQQRELAPEEIQKSVEQVDKLATIAKTLPADGRLNENQFKEGIELIDGREELRKQLADLKASRETLDESVRDIPRPEEQLIEAKLEQSNDKLKELAAGGKYKYDFDPINDVYTKQLGDGPIEQISKERFELEGLEKAFVEETKISRKKAEADQKISDFVDKINAGEDVTSPEDLDFYNQNKKEIDSAIQKPIETEKSAPRTLEEDLVDMFRAEEQAEYDAMENPNDEIKRAEIYDKYDKIITPLLSKAPQEKVDFKNTDWFHGSENEFSEFENRNPNITGFWFSDSKKNAETYGDKIKTVKLDVKNPLVIDAGGKKFTEDIEVEVLAKYPGEKPRLIKLPLDIDEIVWMVKNGKRKNSFIEIPNHSQYDAVVFKNLIDPALSSRSNVPQTSVAVLDKSQIKTKSPSEPFKDVTIKPDPNATPEETIPGLENEGEPLIFQSEKYKDAKEILATKGDVISDAKKAKLQEIVDMGDAELTKVIDAKTEKLNEQDTTNMPEEQKSTFEAVTKIDKSKLNSDQLIQLNGMIDKYNETGKFFDKGNTIEDLYKIQESATPETLNTIKENSLPLNKLNEALENWATLATKIQAVTSNEKIAAIIRVFTGLGEHNKQYGSKKGFEGEMDKTFDEFTALLKKTKVDQSYESQLKIGVVNDIVQHAAGMTPEQVQVEFQGRKKALADGIAEGKKQMAASRKYTKANGQTILALENIYNKYVANANTPEQLKQILSKGENEVRNFMLGKFAGMTDGLNNLSRIYKGKEFDQINEYFPRMYTRPEVRNPKSGKDLKEVSGNLTDISDFASESPEMKLDQSRSTVFDERTLDKDMLPEEKLVNYNALDVFQDNYRKQAYDLYTMKSRSYMSKVLNSPEFLDALNGDKDLLGYYQKAYINRIRNEKSQLRRASEGNLLADVEKFLRNTGNRIALGGLATPYFKQYAPTMASLMVNTGDAPQAMFQAVRHTVLDNKAYKELIAASPISRRYKQEAQFLNGELNATDIKNLGNYFRRLVKGWDETMNKAFMTALRNGDQNSAGLSYLTHYMKNTVERGKYKNYSDFDIEAEAKNPDPIAQQYAEQMTSTTLNVNEGVDRAAKQLGGGWLPFVSFSVNAKANLLTNIGKIATSGGSLSLRDKVTIGQRVAAHVAEILAINKISAVQRKLFIAGSGAALNAIIGSGSEDDEKKEKLIGMVNKYTKEAIEKNDKNVRKYIVQDLVTGQIAGNYTDRMAEDLMEVYNNSSAAIMGKEPERAPRTFRKYEIFKLMGVYGIPIVNAFEGIENLSKFVEPSSVYRQQKFGYIDPYDKIKIEGGREDFERPDWARYSQGAVGVANLLSLFGGSYNEVSAITRRLPQITGGMEKELYGNDKNLESKFLKDQSSPYGYTRLEDDQATIKIGETAYYLKPDQLKEWKKYKADALSRITKENRLEIINSMREAGFKNLEKRADVALNMYANDYARVMMLQNNIDENGNVLLDKKNEVKKK